ncbi:MAG TPA: sugar ABC transporter permease [Marmoricola sp.]|nr:sugar ABC transporter permease [Marmoricola sp.]
MERVLGDKKAIFVLLAPALVVYSAVMLAPVLISMQYTLFTGNAISGFEYVGFDNLTRMVQDPGVRRALWFTLQYGVVLTVTQVGLGYGLALLYQFTLRRGSTVIRTLLFFPVVLPTVAVALLFQRLFQVAPQDGLVNSLLNVFGIGSVDWFGNGGTAFVVIILMDLWRSAGFYAVLLYTGLLDIPEDIMESARLDGASAFSMVRHIVLPLSLPVLLSSLIFSINGTIKVFDSIVALTNGGPGDETTPLTLLMFQTSFSYGQYGYGASIALLLTVLSLLFTLAIFRSARRDNTKV